jgi:hypothetical protein
VSGNIFDCSGCIIRHEQRAWNVNQTQWADKDEQQIPKAGDSTLVARVTLKEVADDY